MISRITHCLRKKWRDWRRMKRLRELTSCCVLLAAIATAQSVPIDTQRSSMMLKVAKAGLFSAFGHNHEIRAPIASGSVDPSARSVRLKVDARALEVLDQDLEADKRAEVQKTMHSAAVLDTARFPERSEERRVGKEWR